MKLAYLAAAAIVAFASPALSASNLFDKTVTNGVVNEPGPSIFLTAGFYDLVFSLSSPGTNSQASFGLWLKEASSTIKDFSLSLQGGDFAKSTGFDHFYLAEGNYYASVFGVAFGGPATVSASISKSVAVPGPEAGAGLGALALGGMALFMKRRRKEEATAA